MFNSTFYPTPKSLIDKMIGKVVGKPQYVLEPSAGKGDILNRFRDSPGWHNRCITTFAIEKDPTLRDILRGKSINVIDSDFLAYSGPDKFDLIIANPPFDEGDKHLLKAIDILYRGQIVFLLNAETIRNPHTNIRKDLKRKLDEMNANIEFIKDGFVDAERKTKVEVALISIVVDRKVEEDLFAGVTDAPPVDAAEIKDTFEVSNGKKKVKELVAEYNQVVTIGTDVIVGYYRGYRKVGKYIGLNKEADKYSFSESDLTAKMQKTLNALLGTVREDFWRRCFELPEVKKRMTQDRKSEFEAALKTRSCMDFTESNVRTFVLNLIDGYENSLMSAVLKLFDKFTKHGYQDQDIYEKNIHYFNGWKTNSAFKVGKKVIIPVYGGYGDGPFTDSYSGKWKMNWGCTEEMRDIDIVMNYFDGMGGDYRSIPKAIEVAFTMGQSRKIPSTYFEITVYKKGTMHLVFNDEEILRRFNVAACKGKGWLPCDYGANPYGKLSVEERCVADSFEGKRSYTEHLGQPLFGHKTSGLQLEM